MVYFHKLCRYYRGVIVKNNYKIACYIVVFFIVAQIMIELFLPIDFIYNGRPVYDVIKDDISTFDFSVKAVKKFIEKENLED